MNRYSRFAAAIVASFTTIGATFATVAFPAPAFAQAAPYYEAKPTAAPAADRAIIRSVVWRCDGGTCTAPRGNSRDAIMCELVARELGTLASFSANGTGFDAAALAKCNEKAR